MSVLSRAELTPSTTWAGAFAAFLFLPQSGHSLSHLGEASAVGTGRGGRAFAAQHGRFSAQQQLQEAGDLPWGFPSAALLKGRHRAGTLPCAQVLLGRCHPRHVGQFGNMAQKTQPWWDMSTPEFASLVLFLLQGPVDFFGPSGIACFCWVSPVSSSSCLWSSAGT